MKLKFHQRKVLCNSYKKSSNAQTYQPTLIHTMNHMKSTKGSFAELKIELELIFGELKGN
jgi:hypothetical protein